MRDSPFPAARPPAPARPTDDTLTASGADYPGRGATWVGKTNSAGRTFLLSPWEALKGLFSFEALLLLYLLGGWKVDSRFAWIPVDPTALFFALSVVVGGFIIVRKGIRLKAMPVVVAMGCLVTWLLVGLLWSPSRVYGPDKVFVAATLTQWALMAGALIIAPDPERVRRLFTLMLLFALVAGADAVRNYVVTGGGFYTVETRAGGTEGAHLQLGQVCGPGALVAVVGWLCSRGSLTGRLCLFFFLGLAFVLAIGGGRNALVATAIALLIPIGLSARLPPGKVLISRSLLSALALLVVAAGGLGLYTLVGAERLGTIVRLTRVESINPRAADNATAIEVWKSAPVLGRGTGSWPMFAGFGDEKNYPHNLFVELLAENGLVGLFLFLSLLWVALRPVTIDRLRRDPQALCAMMLFTCTFLGAMTSGDLPTARAMFMMLGVLALVAIRPSGDAAPSEASLRPAAPLNLPLARGWQAAATERARRARSP
jgi:O-antigen ligase